MLHETACLVCVCVDLLKRSKTCAIPSFLLCILHCYFFEHVHHGLPGVPTLLFVWFGFGFWFRVWSGLVWCCYSFSILFYLQQGSGGHWWSHRSTKTLHLCCDMKVRRHFHVPAFEISWFKLLTSCCVDECCCFQYSWNLNFHDEALNVHKFLSKCVTCGGCPTRCHRAGASTPCNSCPGECMIHDPTPEFTHFNW